MTTPIAEENPFERLHRLEFDIRAILDNLPSMIGYWDRNLLNRFGNHAYFDWFGIDPETMRGMHIRDVIGEERYRLNFPYMEKALKGERQSFERAIPTPDGSAIRHSLAEYIPDIRDGEVLGFFVIVSDVTRLKETEQKLNESETFWRTLVEAEPEWVSIVDAAGLIVQINPAGLNMIEADPSQSVVGTLMTDLLPPSYREAFARTHQSVLDGQSIKMEYEVNGRRGTRRWISSLAVPLKFKGEIAQLCVNRDITERKNLEMNLERSNQDLEQFAYVASHDLRQPLRMISSYLTILERSTAGRLGDEEKDYVAFAVDGAKRMDRMIADLLDYSRLMHDSEQAEAVSLDEIAANAIANLKASIDDVGAVVRIPSPLPNIVGFRTELERLFQNLIGNAVKFVADGRSPEVAITSQDMGSDWRIAISDNGIGMAAEDLPRLFQIFQRLVSHVQYQGAGIGLAACRKIVEHHLGRIWVESEKDVGSTFFFTLPKS